MVLKLLGPHDLKPDFVLPSGSAIKGTVGTLKTLLRDGPLVFHLVIQEPAEPIHKGPFKRAVVRITTGLKNGGNHAEPLQLAHESMRRAMKDNCQVVLHLDVKGYRVQSCVANPEKKRREVDLRLENGSKLQVVGPTGELGEVIDFFSESTVNERDWFSSPPDSQSQPAPFEPTPRPDGTVSLTELPVPRPGPPTGTGTSASRELGNDKRRGKKQAAGSKQPSTTNPGRPMNNSKQAQAMSATDAQAQATGPRVNELFANLDHDLAHSSSHSVVEISEQRQIFTEGRDRPVQKKRRREVSPRPDGIKRTSTSDPANNMTSMPPPAVVPVPGPVHTAIPHPIRIPASTAVQASRDPAASVSKSAPVANSPTADSAVTGSGIGSSSKSPAAAAPKDVPAQPISPQVDPDKHIAKRLKAQKVAERRQARALEQAGLGGQSIVDREERAKRVREEIDAVYKRGLGKAVALAVEYKYNLIAKSLTYHMLDHWVNSERVLTGGERGDTIAVIKNFTFIPSDGRNDNRYNFQLQDPSVDPDDFFILTVFSKTRLEMPNQLLRGSVLLVRDIWVTRGPDGRQRMSGKTQSFSGYQWACLELKPDGTTIEHVGTGRNAVKYPELGPAERQRMSRLKDWWMYVAKPQGASGDSTVGGTFSQYGSNGKTSKRATIGEMMPFTFYDLVAEVLYTSKGHAGVMAVYVTDYTSNSEVEDDDRVLAHHPHLRKMILEVTFWDSNAAEAEKQELKQGDFVFLRNLHSVVKNGTLQGVLHDNVRTGNRATIELGQTWKKMNITDPLVVELLSRKEDLASSRPPTQNETPQAPATASAESDWSETMNESIRTEHTGQPFSTIREILKNPSVPNRFRLKARASAIRPIGKNLGDMVIKWCLMCSRSFTHEYCTKCEDNDLSNAEYRYRFWAILQDERDGPKLPCQMEHRSIQNILHRLPGIKSPAESLTPLFVQATAKIRNVLWDFKVDDVFPRNQIDLSVESYLVEHPSVPDQSVVMYRVFGMTVV